MFKRSIVLVLLSITLAGCHGSSKTSDRRLYDTGEPRSEGWIMFEEHTFPRRSRSTVGYYGEFFESGRLKTETKRSRLY